MDVAGQFRCLVIKNSILDLSVCEQYFAFQTVFYMRGSAYCCCRCSYDHEYFTYISDDGNIDTEKFYRLAQAVESGYCEHAIKIENKEYLKETKVHSIHVAAALGLEDIVESIVTTLKEKGLPIRDRYRIYNKKTIAKGFRINYSGLFQLTPGDIGCLKHSENILHLVDELDPHKTILHATESKNNVLHIEETSLVEIRASENNIATLRNLSKVLESSGTIYYELLFKLDLKDELEEKIEAMKRREYCKFLDQLTTTYPELDYLEPDREIDEDFISVGKLAVIYNKFDIFKKITVAYSDSHFHAGYYEVAKMCDVFQRLEFNKLIDLIIIEMSAKSKLEFLLNLLRKYKLSGDNIKKAIKQIINQQIEGGYTPLQWYICATKPVEISVTRTLIDLGANIDIPLPDSDGKSLLLHILHNKFLKKKYFRELLELFLYENISLVLNISAIPMAIKQCIDLSLDIYNYGRSNEEILQNEPLIQAGAYIMDTTPHMNIFTYLIPLLIEAGFQYSISDILELCTKDSSTIDSSLTASEHVIGNSQASVLHARRTHCHHEQSIPQNPVKAYLQRCLSEPRSLMLRCRDVLRTHFPRRQIHRYVSVMNIPNQIKDFVLLKPILQRLPADIKSESDNGNDQIRKPVSAKGHGLPGKPLSDNHHESASKALPENRHESMRKSSNNQNESRTSSSINHYRSNIVKNKRSRTKNQIV